MFVCHVSCHCPVKFLSFHRILLYLPHLSKVWLLFFFFFLILAHLFPFCTTLKMRVLKKMDPGVKRCQSGVLKEGKFLIYWKSYCFQLWKWNKKAGVLAHVLLILMFEENTATDCMDLQTFLAKASRLRFFIIVQGSWYIWPCADYISVILTSFNFFPSCILLFCM